MTKQDYQLLESRLMNSSEDSAHDAEHSLRVLYLAMEIAGECPDVDWDVLIAACLLHDIGRAEQLRNPKLDHAAVGAQMALGFLQKSGFSQDFALRVSECIRTHRYRGQAIPQSLEAKILFDADKLDVCGAVGIARTLLYEGNLGQPLYFRKPSGSICDADGQTQPCFLREYHRKLRHISSRLFTARAKELARQREEFARQYYQQLLSEIQEPYQAGSARLQERLEG